jgi:two-component system, cell cycle response regulator
VADTSSVKLGIESAAARRGLAVLVATFVAYCLHAQFGLGGKELHSFFNDWLYNAILVACALACFARCLARSGDQRWAWLLIGVALSMWATADIYYTLALQNLAEIPFPSLADAFYLAFYPPAYVALGLLVRARSHTFRASSWLDGVGGALAVAAITAAVVFQAVLSSVAGSSASVVAWNLAYPVADLLLLGVLITSAALSGWRVDRAWGLLTGGLLLFAFTDSVYLYQAAAGTYVDGSILDAGWLAACILFAYAAWQPAPRRRAAAAAESWRMLAVPAGAALLGIGLLVGDHYHRLNTLALVLATLAVLTAVARMALTFLEYLRMIAASRHEASTDSLTGMANRRQLVTDLDEALYSRRPATLALFDLDGFKLYNDTYGHPAGDALLVRLGRALDAAVAGCGRAYRMGGDEFCVVLNSELDESLLDACATALTEAGPGFSIKTSGGAVELPREATTSADALKTADQRMYEQKRGGRRSAGHQSAEVLLGVVEERDRELGERAVEVSELAHRVARRLDLTPDEADDVAHAAQLQDIGKVGVPDAILNKPGPLTPEELEFIHRHTLIGERIVRRAPALEGVAKLVRSSHERWDGSGYPDGLAGTDIPLGARIISVCDAFDAMVSARPYRHGMTVRDALAEIERCAGEQFDPAVVEALTAVMAEDGAQHLAA